MFHWVFEILWVKTIFRTRQLKILTTPLICSPSKKNHFSKFGGLAQKYSLPRPLIGMGMAGLIFKDKKMILVSYVDWLQICKKARSPSNPVL